MVPAYDHGDPSAADIHQGGFGYKGGKRGGYRCVYGVAADSQHCGTGFCRLRVTGCYDTLHLSSHLLAFLCG
jgi:hypothetical protein